LDMPICIIRGATPVNDTLELQAHLAALLRLENVGLLLGAGASVSAGGKTMVGLWDDFLATTKPAAEWLVEQNFIPEEALADGEGRHIPNLEELADLIEIALAEWRRRQDEAVIDLESVRADIHRALVRAAQLQQQWWDSLTGAEDHPLLKDHRSVLQKLIAARQPGQAAPWVFTTNYDLAIEWAAESIDLQVTNGFLGTHSRKFSPQSFDIGFRNIQARGEARFGAYNIYLAKLHGSLSWREENEQVYEIPARLAGQDIKRFLEEEQDELGLMVMPSAAKYMQTVGFVLGELFRRFAEFLSKAQTSLLISGYSFGDEHINRLLKSALLNPTLQLVIYFPEFNGDVVDPNLPDALRKLLALQNPRVTVVGGNAEAYFDKLASHLPDPLLYDDEMRRLRKELMPQEPAADMPGIVNA
jgi:hypothetical protein